VFARVAEIINGQRRAVGNPKSVSFRTLRKAWEQGWTEQVGGRPAPALKTLFPHIGPVSYKHDEPELVAAAPEPAAADSKPTAPRAGASPAGAPDAAGQAPNVPRHDQSSDTLTPENTAMIPATSAEGVQLLDPLKAAILKLDEGRANALLNEMTILGRARSNIIGLEEIANTVINALAARKDIITRMIGDLAHSDAATLRTVRDTLREVAQFMKDIALTNKTIQESQRLLVGMPQRIEERRGANARDEEQDDRAVARMSRMLRTTRLTVSDEIDNGTYQSDSHPMMVQQNKWRATRFGNQANLVDMFTHEVAPVSVTVERLVDRLSLAAEFKYRGYLKRHDQQLARTLHDEGRPIPPAFQFRGIPGLSREVVSTYGIILPVSISGLLSR
jgi:hypothetical protein